MTASSAATDMAGGANVLRCLADFITARPGLPDLAAIEIFWSYESQAWEIQGQLPRDEVAAVVVRWSMALDDPVITSKEQQSQYTGPYVLHQVTGTIHGHPVRVWGHMPIRGGA